MSPLCAVWDLTKDPKERICNNGLKEDLEGCISC